MALFFFVLILILLNWNRGSSYESSIKVQARARKLNWVRALDRWNQLYYCEKDDGVFIPLVTNLVPTPSINSLLFGDWKSSESSPQPAWLEIEQEGHAGWKYFLEKRTSTYLGRREGNQIRLAHDPDADARHAVIYCENGRFWVSNLSHKGVRVNGIYIVRQMLVDGSTIQVGSTLFIFRETRQ